MTQNIELILQITTCLILLSTLIWVVGIVWRVEAELDIAYKWFTAAVVLTLGAEITALMASVLIADWLPSFFPVVLRWLSAWALLLGMYYMRDLVRRMDGEKRG